MALVPATCTNCGANIEVDNSEEAGICKFCGTAYITEKVINNYITNVTNTNIFNNATVTVVDDNLEKLHKTYLFYVKSGRNNDAKNILAQLINEYPYDSFAYEQKLNSALSKANKTDMAAVQYIQLNNIYNELINALADLCTAVSPDKFEIFKKKTDPVLNKIAGILNIKKIEHEKSEAERIKKEEFNKITFMLSANKKDIVKARPVIVFQLFLFLILIAGGGAIGWKFGFLAIVESNKEASGTLFLMLAACLVVFGITVFCFMVSNIKDLAVTKSLYKHQKTKLREFNAKYPK